MRCGEGIQAGVEPRMTAIWSASMIWRLSRGVAAAGSWTGLMLDWPAAGGAAARYRGRRRPRLGG